MQDREIASSWINTQAFICICKYIKEWILTIEVGSRISIILITYLHSPEITKKSTKLSSSTFPRTFPRQPFRIIASHSRLAEKIVRRYEPEIWSAQCRCRLYGRVIQGQDVIFNTRALAPAGSLWRGRSRAPQFRGFTARCRRKLSSVAGCCLLHLLGRERERERVTCNFRVDRRLLLRVRSSCELRKWGGDNGLDGYCRWWLIGFRRIDVSVSMYYWFTCVYLLHKLEWQGFTAYKRKEENIEYFSELDRFNQTCTIYGTS